MRGERDRRESARCRVRREGTRFVRPLPRRKKRIALISHRGTVHIRRRRLMRFIVVRRFRRRGIRLLLLLLRGRCCRIAIIVQTTVVSSVRQDGRFSALLLLRLLLLRQRWVRRRSVTDRRRGRSRTGIRTRRRDARADQPRRRSRQLLSLFSAVVIVLLLLLTRRVVRIRGVRVGRVLILVRTAAAVAAAGIATVVHSRERLDSVIVTVIVRRSSSLACRRCGIQQVEVLPRRMAALSSRFRSQSSARSRTCSCSCSCSDHGAAVSGPRVFRRARKSQLLLIPPSRRRGLLLLLRRLVVAIPAVVVPAVVARVAAHDSGTARRRRRWQVLPPRVGIPRIQRHLLDALLVLVLMVILGERWQIVLFRRRGGGESSVGGVRVLAHLAAIVGVDLRAVQVRDLFLVALATEDAGTTLSNRVAGVSSGKRAQLAGEEMARRRTPKKKPEVRRRIMAASVIQTACEGILC